MGPAVAKAGLRIAKPWFKPPPAVNATMSLGMCKEREFWNKLFIPFLWMQLLDVW